MLSGRLSAEVFDMFPLCRRLMEWTPFKGGDDVIGNAAGIRQWFDPSTSGRWCGRRHDLSPESGIAFPRDGQLCGKTLS